MRVLTVYAHPSPASFDYLQRAYRLGHEFEPSPTPVPEPYTITRGVR